MAPPKKDAPKAAAPKLSAKKGKAATKASAPSNAIGTPSNKTGKKDAASAKAAGTSATSPTVAPLDVPTLPGELPPDQKAQPKKATAKTKDTAATKATPARPGRPKLPNKTQPSKKAERQALQKATGTTTPKTTTASPNQPASTGQTPQQPANTSRKRRSASIEEDEEEVEPVATRTATKKLKAGPGRPKRKAPVDASDRPKKAPRIDEQEEQEDDPVDSVNPRLKNPAKKAAASANKAASSRPKAPKSRANATAAATGRKAAVPVKKAPKSPKVPAVKLQAGVQINFAPTQPLDIFIFGSGDSGELGLGNKKLDGKKPVNVKRPRLHPLLSAEDVGVVQIACGGMHSVALTKDNRILTWGVNDQGALGRSTAWDGGLRDADAEDDDDGDDFEALNPIECTPAEVSTKNIVNGTKFVKVVASDSASFALTEQGRLYGWGTFRVSRSHCSLLSTN